MSQRQWSGPLHSCARRGVDSQTICARESIARTSLCPVCVRCFCVRAET